MAWNRRVDVARGLGARRPSPLFRSLVTLGWLFVIGLTFALGYGLAWIDASHARATLDALRAEIGLLSEEVARGREERLRLERMHQMDRESRRQAQESLAELQRQRLDLIKRVSYLQRLVRDDREGVVEVKELQLHKTPMLGHFHFDLLLSHLVPQDARTRGRLSLSVVISRDAEEEQLSLDALPGSSSANIAIDFKHFQAVAGDIVLPEGVDAERLIVDIRPEGTSTAPSSEAFLWPGEPGTACSLSPILEMSGLAEPAAVE